MRCHCNNTYRKGSVCASDICHCQKTLFTLTSTTFVWPKHLSGTSIWVQSIWAIFADKDLLAVKCLESTKSMDLQQRERVESVSWQTNCSAPEADDRAILHALLKHCWKAFKCSDGVVITKLVPNVCAGFHDTISAATLCGTTWEPRLKCIPFWLWILAKLHMEGYCVFISFNNVIRSQCYQFPDKWKCLNNVIGYKLIQSSVNYNKGLCLLMDGCGRWLLERCLLVPTYDQHP